MATNRLMSTGGEYTLMSQWEADLPATLTEPEILDCYKGTTINGPWLDDGSYQEVVTLAGFTPSAENRVIIKAADGQAHGGVFGAGFKITGVSTANILTTDVDYVTLKDLEMYVPAGAWNGFYGRKRYSIFENLLVTDDATESSTNAIQTYIGANGNPAYVINCVVVGNNTTRSLIKSHFDVWVYNCTTTGGRNGFSLQDQTRSKLINCVAAGADQDDYIWTNLSSGEFANNASSDTTAPGTDAQNGVVLTPGVDFVDPSNDDYRPATDGKLQGKGTSPARTPLDIAGDTRNDPDDIGAYAAAGGPILVKEMYVKDSNAFVNAAPNLRIGGAWQEVEAHVRSGGVWVKVHDK